MGAIEPGTTISFGRFRIEDRALWLGRTRIPLPPKESALLQLLAEAGGRIVSKTEILEQLWPGEDVGEASITRCVRGVRRVLQEGGRRGGTIETVHGRGYRLALPVHATGPAPGAEAGGPLRVAVSPFENAGGRREDAYLGAALAGEVTDALAKARVEGVAVLARQSGRRFRRGAPDLFRLGRQLRLDYLVTGWLRLAEDELRGQVELVRVGDETLVWSEPFHAPTSAISRAAGKIAAGTARELARLGARSAPDRAGRAPSVRPRSYLALLQGQFEGQLRTERGLRRAVELFERAIAWDPGHAAAYAALADAQLMLAFWGYEAPLAIAPRVRNLIQRALALDRRLVSAHASLAYLRYAIDFEPDTALRTVDRALALEPGHSRSEWIRGLILHVQGRLDDALAAYGVARESDPFSPMLALGAAFDLFCMGRVEPALAAFRALTASEPEFATGHALRAAVAVCAGRPEEAIRAAAVAESIARGNAVALGVTAWALAKAGRTAQAAELRAALERRAARRYVPPSFLALAQLGAGDAEAAIATLERGLALRCMHLPFLAVDPLFAALRDDPRFERIAAIARGLSPGAAPPGPEATGASHIRRASRRRAARE